MANKLIGCLLIATGIVIMLLALSGCYSGGLLSMSDEWCAKHPQAGLSRCKNPAHGDTFPTQAYSPSAECSEPGAGAHPYDVQGTFLLCW